MLLPARSGKAIADGSTALSPAPNAVLVADESGLAADINRERGANGVAPLTLDAQLTTIARARSLDQVTQHYFSHTSPEGQTVFDLLDAANIPWTTAGENLAESDGLDPAQAAINGFDTSPPHRANMLNTAFGRVGVGAAQTADGTTILTVVFTN